MSLLLPEVLFTVCDDIIEPLKYYEVRFVLNTFQHLGFGLYKILIEAQ